jgi:uncharacterized membrane protein
MDYGTRGLRAAPTEHRIEVERADGGRRKALGWAALGLGAVQLATPRGVTRLLGLRGSGAEMLVRLAGAAEAAAGAGLVGEDARPAEARAAVTVAGPAEAVYEAWRDVESFPRFMAHVTSVQVLEDGRSHWRVEAPAGTVEWDAEIVEDVPGERISWRSLPGADVETSGTVRFAPAPGDRGTEVRLELRYAAPAGRAGTLVAKLLGQEPAQQAKDDLRRFKQVLETGELARSDALPRGIDASRALRQRPARPLEELPR